MHPAPHAPPPTMCPASHHARPRPRKLWGISLISFPSAAPARGSLMRQPMNSWSSSRPARACVWVHARGRTTAAACNPSLSTRCPAYKPSIHPPLPRPPAPFSRAVDPSVPPTTTPHRDSTRPASMASRAVVSTVCRAIVSTACRAVRFPQPRRAVSAPITASPRHFLTVRPSQRAHHNVPITARPSQRTHHSAPITARPSQRAHHSESTSLPHASASTSCQPSSSTISSSPSSSPFGSPRASVSRASKA